MLDTKTHRKELRIIPLLISLVILFLCSTPGTSQVRTNPNGNPNEEEEIPEEIDPAVQDSLNSLQPDTTIFDVFYLDEPFKLKPFEYPTLKDLTFYDPNEQWGNVNLTLGVLGGSTRNFTVEKPKNTLGDFGYADAYLPYFFDLSTFPLMQTNRPFSSVGFSPFEGQESFIAEGYLSQNIGRQGTITVGFKRYKQADYYINAESRASSMVAAYRYRGKKNKYQGVLSYLGRFSDENINGGVTEPDSISTNESNFRTNVQTFITDGTSRFHDYAINADNSWRITRGKNALTLQHHASIQYGLNKYGDRTIDILDQDTVYQQYAFDEAGIRNYQGFNHLQTSATVKTQLFNIIRFSGNVGYHRYQINYDRVTTRTQSQLVLGLKGGINWKDNITLLANIETSTLDNVVYNLSQVDFGIDLDELLHFNGSIYRHTYPTKFNDNVLYVNAILQFDNTFDPQSQTGIDLSVSSKKLGTSLQAKIAQLNNQVYYERTSLPSQSTEGISMLQLSTSQNLRLRKFHLDNHITYQTYSDNIWNLPDFYTQHDLYFYDILFDNNLILKTGIYARLMKSNARLNYQPVTRAFYAVEGEGFNIYPRVDYYITANIRNFEVFIRYENFVDFIRDDVEMHVYGYPQFDHRFRLGVKWLLKD